MKRPRPKNHEIKLNPKRYIVSKTDTDGIIEYGNDYFVEISGYKESELIGKPHNIIRHPDMPKVVFKLLWSRIQNKEEIFAYVKNLSKDGGYYWVFANITASLDINGNIIGYYSVRRKPSDEGIKVMSEVYAKMIELERSGGMEASGRYLNDILKSKGMSYDELIAELQG